MFFFFSQYLINIPLEKWAIILNWKTEIGWTSETQIQAKFYGSPVMICKLMFLNTDLLFCHIMYKK